MGRAVIRRSVVAFAALALIAAGLVPLMLPALPAQAQEAAPSRLSGADRYETAAAVARATFPNGVSTVVLGSGVTFADSLAGAYYAGIDNASCVSRTGMLLTAPSSLSPAARQAIRDLRVAQVVILGGPQAVTESVASELRSITSTSTNGGPLTVLRVSGTNRWDTMYRLNIACGLDAVGSVGGKRTALVASGLNFPDALAAAGAAYGRQLPLVLTPPDQLGAEARRVLSELQIEQVLIMGGAGAVGPAVNSAITQMGITIAAQFGGANRQDTAAQFAAYATANLGFSDSVVALARGTDFADALTGAQYTAPTTAAATSTSARSSYQAAGSGAPLLLTQDPTHLGADTSAYLARQADFVDGILALGGTGSVSEGTRQNATAVADKLRVDSITPTEVTNNGEPVQLTFTGTFPTKFHGSLYLGFGSPDACGTPLRPASADETTLRVTFTLPETCQMTDWVVGAAFSTDGVDATINSLWKAVDVIATLQSVSPGAIPDDGQPHTFTATGRGLPDDLGDEEVGAYAAPAAANSSSPTGPCGDGSGRVFVAQPTATRTELTGVLTFPEGCQSGLWDLKLYRYDRLVICASCITVGDAEPPAETPRITISPTSPVFGETITVTYSGGASGSGDWIGVFSEGSATCVAHCPPTDSSGRFMSNSPGASGSFSFSISQEQSASFFTVFWDMSATFTGSTPGCDSHRSSASATTGEGTLCRANFEVFLPS